MSVINEMLRSLDESETEFVSIDSSPTNNDSRLSSDPATSGDIIEEGPSFIRWIAGTIFLIALTGGGYYWLRADPNHLVDPSELVTTNTQVIENDTPVANVSATEPSANSNDLTRQNLNQHTHEKHASLGSAVELKPISLTIDKRLNESNEVDEKKPASLVAALSTPIDVSTEAAMRNDQSPVQTDKSDTVQQSVSTISTALPGIKQSAKQALEEQDKTVLRFTPHVKSTEDQIREQQQTAQRALLQNDYHTAETALRIISELKPNDQNRLVDWLKVWLLVAPSEAETRIDAELSANPHNAQFKQLKASAFIHQQRYIEAYNLLSVQPPALHLHRDYYSLLALSAQQSNQHEAAFQYYSALVQSFPDSGAFYAGAAISADHLQRYSIALPLYTRALQDNQLADALRTYALQRRSELLRANL